MKSPNKLGHRHNPTTCLRLQIRFTVCLENLGIIRSAFAAPTSKKQKLRLFSHCELIMIVACCSHFTPCDYCAVECYNLPFSEMVGLRTVWSGVRNSVGAIFSLPVPDRPQGAPSFL